jgi:hypothetical protein
VGIAAVRTLLALGLVLSSASAPASTDPCNFQTGQVFPYEQVLACYESVPFQHEDLENAIEVVSAWRERSDLRNVYDVRIGWRERLAALDDPATREDYASDFAMQTALSREHKSFFNVHIRYVPPSCYWGMLAAFVPFEFGSTLEGPARRQIVFVEGTPFLPALYETATGVDARPFVGQRVVSINGVDPLEYFRAYGREAMRLDRNDGLNLSSILTFAAYSVRAGPFAPIPAAPSDVYVFEDRRGRRVVVEMPWVFAPTGLFASFGLLPGAPPQTPLTGSTEAFAARCGRPVPPATEDGSGPAGSLALLARPTPASPLEDLSERRDMVRRMWRPPAGVRGDYFEVPPGQIGKFVGELAPATNGARVLAYKDDATIVRLDDFVQDWSSQVAQGTSHACAHSDRLILDLRGNTGGGAIAVAWLVRHLLPDRTDPFAYQLVSRMLNVETGWSELATRAGLVAASHPPGTCLLGLEPGCFVDPFTGQPFVDVDWFEDSTFEVRGGVTESLSPPFYFSDSSPLNPPFASPVPIACPGKFEDDRLVVLTNGLSFSAAYFFTERIRDRATVVTAGGYAGEPLVAGAARGGAGLEHGLFSLLEALLAIPFGPATDPLPPFTREVLTFMELLGVYRPDRGGLEIEGEPVGDLHVDVWSDSREADGYVYGRVLQAVAMRGGVTHFPGGR